MPVAAHAAPPRDQDVGHVGQGLDVVDHGRLAEDADLAGERRLRARLAAPALERVEERRLLAADVGPGAATHLDVEAVSRSGDVLAEQAGGAGRADGGGEMTLRTRDTRPRM